MLDLAAVARLKGEGIVAAAKSRVYRENERPL